MLKSNTDTAKTILYIEDDGLISLAQTIVMRKRWGYKVILANSGEEALEIMKKDRQNGLILGLIDIDLGIDHMNGIEAARKIEQIYHIPFIFLTSHNEPEYINKAKNIEKFCGYLNKPFTKEVLKSSIELAFKLLSEKEGE
jgi:CheY-like chemotaxis protein